MAHVNRSVATLRIFGDDLLPADISELLNCEPTVSQIKGDITVGKNTGRKRTAKIGMWLIQATEQIPENIDGQISEILAKLNPDLKVWQDLSKRYEVDFYCGLFMNMSNEGMSLSPASMKSLNQRGVQLNFDIYSGNDEPPKPNELCPCDSGKNYGLCCGKAP